jgi:hypothetical protein
MQVNIDKGQKEQAKPDELGTGRGQGLLSALHIGAGAGAGDGRMTSERLKGRV